MLDPAQRVETMPHTSIEPLIQWLPGPCDVILVGSSVDATFQSLLELGYRVKCIRPVFSDASSLASWIAENKSFVLSRSERFGKCVERWDLLLFQDSLVGVDALGLLSMAKALLGSTGEIVVAEPSLPDNLVRGDRIEYPPTWFLALAARFGFDLIETKRLGDCGAHNFELLKETSDFQTFHFRDLSSVRVHANRCSSLSDSRCHETFMREGFFQAFKLRMNRSRLQIPGWVRSEHFDQLKNVFSIAFNGVMSRELWEWKYGENRGQGVGVWEDGQLVAHYGGLCRRILYFGSQELASQSADVMVIPSSRKSLARNSAFFIAAATYLELTTGFGRQYLLGFGFPNERARRAPELLGLYSKPISKMVALTWTTSSQDIRSRFFRQWQLDLSAASDAALVDWCWSRMATATQQFILGIRDVDWLIHRYVKHPHNEYLIHAVSLRWQSRPFGIVVLKKHADDVYELMDIIAQPSRIKWLMIALKGTLIPERGKIITWISEPLAGFFPSDGEKSDLQIGIPSCIWTEGPAASSLIDRWWLMGGDTDFL